MDGNELVFPMHCSSVVHALELTQTHTLPVVSIVGEAVGLVVGGSVGEAEAQRE